VAVLYQEPEPAPVAFKSGASRLRLAVKSKRPLPKSVAEIVKKSIVRDWLFCKVNLGISSKDAKAAEIVVSPYVGVK